MEPLVAPPKVITRTRCLTGQQLVREFGKKEAGSLMPHLRYFYHEGLKSNVYAVHTYETATDSTTEQGPIIIDED